jgi:NAD(P)-dependent dehydrogenase (short-subunit alcohol dehydrogenase family)
LIVGAGDALGSALAHKFAKEGFLVCAVRRNAEKLSALKRDIESSNNNSIHNNAKCEIFPADARKEEDMAQVVKEIESNLGPIDVAIHNIGANVRYSLLDPDMTAKKYYKVWEMASLSAFLMSRVVLPKMVERKQGTVLFTGATASLRGGANYAAFSGAMFAKRALAQSMAREFGPQNIHVAHVIIDGGIQTEFVKGILGEDTYNQAVQGDALLTPEAIAENFWHLHQQPRVAWTHELDLRPWVEKW